MARVFVSDRDSDCCWSNPGRAERFGIHLRVARQCRAKNDCVRLTERNLMSEGRLEAIKEASKGDAIDSFQLDGEERGGQAESHDSLADGGVFIVVERVAVDPDGPMAGEAFRQDNRADCLTQHPQFKSSGAVDYLKSFVGIQKGAFDIEH